jgi:nucleoside 2-deoxyribosyltransferase
MIKKVYIAAPLFNEKEIAVIEKIKKCLNDLNINFYSPKDEFKFKKGDSFESARQCYYSNINAMNTCSHMIAVIDDFDPGTIFEIGYFVGFSKPVIAYSNVKGRGLNLMLAQACVGFANNEDELKNTLTNIIENKHEDQKYTGEQV